MFLHVRAKPRRAPFKLDLPHEPTFHERVEGVIDRCVGNFRHRLLRAHEDFFRRRMIALMENHVINMLSLRRETEAARIEPFAKFIAVFFLDCVHLRSKIVATPALVKI